MASKKYPYTIEYESNGEFYRMGSRFFLKALGLTLQTSQSRISDVVLWKEGAVLAILKQGKVEFGSFKIKTEVKRLLENLNSVES